MPYIMSARFVINPNFLSENRVVFIGPLFSVSLSAKADAKISGLFLTFQTKFEKVLIYFE